MSVEHEIHINADILHVFNLLNDPVKTLDWMEGLTAITRGDNYVEETPLGGEYVMHIKEGRAINAYQCKVLAYREPTRFTVELKGPTFSLVNAYKLARQGSGTHLEFRSKMDSKFKHVKLLGWLFKGFSKRIVTKQFTKLKALAEAS